MQLEMIARNAMVNAFRALLTAGSKLEFRTSAGAVVASLPASEIPFGAAENGVIVAGPFTAAQNAPGGLINRAVLLNAQLMAVATMTVGTSVAEIVMPTLTIAPGSSVPVTSLTITMPAS